MVKYITQDGNVIAVEFEGGRFPLKESKKFSEMEKYSDALDKVEKIIDFDARNVTTDAIKEFVLWMWPRTGEYLKLLLSEKRWFASEEIQKKLKIKAQGISGVRAALTKRADSLKIGYVDEVEWTEEGARYRIKDIYRDMLIDALGLS